MTGTCRMRSLVLSFCSVADSDGLLQAFWNLAGDKANEVDIPEADLEMSMIRSGGAGEKLPPHNCVQCNRSVCGVLTCTAAAVRLTASEALK